MCGQLGHATFECKLYRPVWVRMRPKQPPRERQTVKFATAYVAGMRGVQLPKPSVWQQQPTAQSTADTQPIVRRPAGEQNAWSQPRGQQQQHNQPTQLAAQQPSALEQQMARLTEQMTEMMAHMMAQQRKSDELQSTLLKLVSKLMDGWPDRPQQQHQPHPQTSHKAAPRDSSPQHTAAPTAATPSTASTRPTPATGPASGSTSDPTSIPRGSRLATADSTHSAPDSAAMEDDAVIPAHSEAQTQTLNTHQPVNGAHVVGSVRLYHNAVLQQNVVHSPPAHSPSQLAQAGAASPVQPPAYSGHSAPNQLYPMINSRPNSKVRPTNRRRPPAHLTQLLATAKSSHYTTDPATDGENRISEFPSQTTHDADTGPLVTGAQGRVAGESLGSGGGALPESYRTAIPISSLSHNQNSHMTISPLSPISSLSHNQNSHMAISPLSPLSSLSHNQNSHMTISSLSHSQNSHMTISSLSHNQSHNTAEIPH